MILAEIESQNYNNIDMDKLKAKFINLKTSLKDTIQKSIVKTYPLTELNLKDDEVENLKDRKQAMNRTGTAGGKNGFGATAGKGGFGAKATPEDNTTLSI